MKNILTIDVEDWFHTNDLNIPIMQYDKYPDRIVESTTELLDLLDNYKLKATFFILGCIAKKHPELVGIISKKGHEIGSHGYWHKLIYKQSPEEFRNELIDSKNILEDVTGKIVNLYRAPSWSITKECLWALRILEEEGFICSSSIYPTKNPLYGINTAPTEPYYPIINGEKLKILEYPPGVYQIWKYRVPIAGGLYLRIMPWWLTKKAITHINKQKPLIIYSHPWELDTKMPRLKVSPVIRLTHYYNLHTIKNKLNKLFVNFEYTTLGERINEENYAALSIEN